MLAPPDNTAANPALTAVMCDGMGWFSKNDFKRMLLLYDRILYLVPSETVEFRDLDGHSRYILISKALKEVGFELQYYQPDKGTGELIMQSALADARRESFARAVADIPQSERIYTWQMTNADADLGRGSSVALDPDEQVLAHALLLNKFLIAADSMDAVPITGKNYIHALITDKYRMAQAVTQESGWTPSIGQPSLTPIAVRVIDAIVADEDLEQRSEAQIVEYKEKHRRLFEAFSYTIRKLVKQVSALPGSRDFDRQVSELIGADVWRDKMEIERELRGAWTGFFKSGMKSAVAGAVTLGITPFLSLGTLTFASVLAGVAAAAPWAASELIGVLEKRKKAQQHGIYYLMNFRS